MQMQTKMDELRQDQVNAEMESKELREENIRTRKDMEVLEIDL